jgi:sugar lactone lactonase YvrE
MKKLLIKSFLACVLMLIVVVQTKAQIITTVAGNSTVGAGFSGDGGLATSALLFNPTGVAVDGSGNFFIADSWNYRVRKVNTSGVISTFAGNGTSAYSGDGGLATAAELSFPVAVAVDGTGNLFIADELNHRIRKVNPSGIITTVAGVGTAGFSGDGGLATSAQLNNPSAVAVDGTGNLYIADYSNNRIRKVNTAGIISTIAGVGTAGFGGDGGAATSAKLNAPFSVVIDAVGNIYISDTYNNVIRKVNTSGIISTIAGKDTLGFSGDGGPATLAKLNQPTGVTVDATGNIYLSDWGNRRIRKVNASGIINTIVGNGVQGYSGDGGPATSAELNYPQGLAIGPTGNIYIADRSNSGIRMVSLTTTGINELSNSKDLIFPNPNNGSFNIRIGNTIENGELILFNSLGQQVHEQKITQGENKIITNGLAQGLYHYTLLQNKSQVSNGKIAIE